MPVSSKKAKSMSKQQLALIVSAMENNATQTSNREGRNFSKEIRKEKWAELAKELNALGGAIKTSEKWQKCWSDKKNDLKRKVSRIIEDRAKPGGPTSEERLTSLEERIMKLAGWSEGIRDDELHQKDSNSDCTYYSLNPEVGSYKFVNIVESKDMEVNEAVDNLVEVSVAMDAENPSESLNNTPTIITFVPATIQNLTPTTTTSSILTRQNNLSKLPGTYLSYTNDMLNKAISDVVDQGLSIRQAAEKHGIPRKTLGNKIQGKRDEDAANSSAEATPTASIKEPPQEHLARKPYETASLSRIAAACEINNCKLQEQTVTLQQISAALQKPEEATALKRLAAACEINNCKMQEQTETLQRLTATLTRPDETAALHRIAAACETRANEAVKQTLLLEKICSTLNR